MPWPPDTGGHIRTFHLLRALAEHSDVRLVVPCTQPPVAGREALAHVGVRAVEVPVLPRTLARESVKALAATAAGEPYVLFARHRHRAVQQALRREARNRRPDVLYLDHLDSLVYARSCPGVPIVFDMHNVYSRLASRAASEAEDCLRRQYLRHQAQLLGRTEERAARLARVVLTVSDDEARYYAHAGAEQVFVVPNGVDCGFYESIPVADRSGTPTILYVGAMSWGPNVNAARFLAEEVLPIVRNRLPDARLRIVGKNPAPGVMALASADNHVEVAANVADVRPHLRAAHVLAVPLQAAGGTRLKILEAFAAGLPVVSTPVGCEGIRTVDGEHLIVADRAAFATSVLELLVNPLRAGDLAARARALAREFYDWRVVGRIVCEAVARAAARPLGHAALPSVAAGTVSLREG